MQVDQTPQASCVNQYNTYEDNTLVAIQTLTDIPSEPQTLWLSALIGHLDQWFNAQKRTSLVFNQQFEDSTKNLDQRFATQDRHDGIIEQNSKELRQQYKQMQTAME